MTAWNVRIGSQTMAMEQRRKREWKVEESSESKYLKPEAMMLIWSAAEMNSIQTV